MYKQLTYNIMKPYGKNAPKYHIEKDRHSGIPGTSKHFTQGHKLEVRNANRSRKKSERQNTRIELKQYI